MIRVPIDKILPLEELEKKIKDIVDKTHGNDFYVFTRENKPIVAMVGVDYLEELTKEKDHSVEGSGEKMKITSQAPIIKPHSNNAQKEEFIPKIKPVDEKRSVDIEKTIQEQKPKLEIPPIPKPMFDQEKPKPPVAPNIPIAETNPYNLPKDSLLAIATNNLPDSTKSDKSVFTPSINTPEDKSNKAKDDVKIDTKPFGSEPALKSVAPSASPLSSLGITSKPVTNDYDVELDNKEIKNENDLLNPDDQSSPAQFSGDTTPLSTSTASSGMRTLNFSSNPSPNSTQTPTINPNPTQTPNSTNTQGQVNPPIKPSSPLNNPLSNNQQINKPISIPNSPTPASTNSPAPNVIQNPSSTMPTNPVVSENKINPSPTPIPPITPPQNSPISPNPPVSAPNPTPTQTNPQSTTTQNSTPTTNGAEVDDMQIG